MKANLKHREDDKIVAKMWKKVHTWVGGEVENCYLHGHITKK